MTKTVISFYFGLGSRYSYLAATQLAAIEKEYNCQFDWIPLQSGELVKRANNGFNPFYEKNVSGQYNWDYRQTDAEAWANYYQVPYIEPKDFRTDPVDMAKACWAANEYGKLKEMAWQIFEAIFINSQTIDRGELSLLADKIGLSGDSIITALDSSKIERAHETYLKHAINDGAFGVPTFTIDDQLFWGNDRLPLLRNYLGKGEGLSS